jgi:hypothetical protein
MAFLAGENITAGRLNRLQPKPYFVKATGSLAAGSTNADVPGCSIPFTTEAANAVVKCSWSTDYDLSGASTTLASSRLLLDGATGSDVFTINQENAGGANDRITAAQFWQFTVASAGAHTIKMTATTPANVTINVYTVIELLVIEVA